MGKLKEKFCKDQEESQELISTEEEYEKYLDSLSPASDELFEYIKNFQGFEPI